MSMVKLDGIQFLRLFAALLVVLDHSLASLMDNHALEANYGFAFRSGGFGVLVFFVVSGFIMAQSMYDRFGHAGTPAAFLKRRITRIVPMYWLVTLAMAAKDYLATGASMLVPLLCSLGFIPYLSESGSTHPVLSVGWTLNYEMLFYLIFCGCLFFSRWVGIVLVSLIIGGLVTFGDALTGMISSPFLKVAVDFWTNSIMLLFLAGVWLGAIRGFLERRVSVKEINSYAAIALQLLWIVTFELLLYYGHMSVWLERTLALTLVAAVGMVNSAARGLVCKFVKLLGDASYSLYLTHGFAIVIAFRVRDVLSLSLSPIVSILLAMVAATTGGLLAYKFVEQPMLKYLRERRRHPVPPVPANSVS